MYVKSKYLKIRKLELKMNWSKKNLEEEMRSIEEEEICG